jgi:hypothetical protein
VVLSRSGAKLHRSIQVTGTGPRAAWLPSLVDHCNTDVCKHSVGRRAVMVHPNLDEKRTDLQLGTRSQCNT